ncbi:hypothetical protein DB2_76 [Octadecabacter Antarctic DB virus 2]|nr:hypothetical protein DB2_76 [Octadecabacter Antarctic DB virus 2]
MTDPEILRSLLNGKFTSLTIGFNEDHSCNYVTAEGWRDEYGFYLGGKEDIIDWASEDERLKAIAENSVWTIQWYPNTPVGFCIVGASSFETAAQYALGKANG